MKRYITNTPRALLSPEDRALAQKVIRERVKRGRHARRASSGVPPIGTHCPICILPFETTGIRKAVFDHCHQGGHFRAWICDECNRGLGVFRDDPERLRRAAAYLELDKARNPLPPVLSDPEVRRKI